tara:strand:+ start:1571 stop:2260 length:690 start_codon:yes stop_codon:yes gene_type:complete
MYKVLLIRHGESIWNHSSRFTGWTDIPLTNKGIFEGEIISKYLISTNNKPNLFFSSVLNRAIDTTYIIKNYLQSDAPVYTSWRLNEKHYGTLEGVSRKFIRDNYGEEYTNNLRHNFYIKPPIISPNYRYCSNYPIFKNCYYEKIKYGESKEDVIDRALPYFENDILYCLQDNKLPLIVTHKHCIRVLMKYYLDLNDTEFENYNIPNNTIIEMYFNKDIRFEGHKLLKYL